jgi:hypothetical protein
MSFQFLLLKIFLLPNSFFELKVQLGKTLQKHIFAQSYKTFLAFPDWGLNPGSFFHIDVTYEMRTVLYRSSLLIDNVKMSDRVLISNRDCGEESRTAERQRESV